MPVSSPLDLATTAASSPRNDLVKNCRCTRHWLISTQVAINGALLIEVDAEAFASLVERLRTLPRPLTLTFAAGEGRERAFALQLRRRAASLVPPVPPPVASTPPPPRRRRQAADDDAERTQCGLTCFGSAYVCA